MIPGHTTSKITIRRAGGEEKEFVVTEEMAQFFMRPADPLLETVEFIANSGEPDDWAPNRAKVALTEHYAGIKGGLLQCIERLATGSYQGSAFTHWATDAAASALHRYRAIAADKQ